jgi:uncharacterized protein (DUF1919 family)
MGYEGSPEGAEIYKESQRLHRELKEERLAIEIALKSQNEQIINLMDQLLVATKLIHHEEIDDRRKILQKRIKNLQYGVFHV